MDDIKFRPRRLSDVFLPREPMVSRRADKLRFVFDSTKSGRRERNVTLHAVTVSNEGHIVLECLCAESGESKSFRFANIVSDIVCEEKYYVPEEFLTEYLGIPREEWLAARQKAIGYTHIRNNFEKYVGESLEEVSPIWTGSADLVCKFRRKSHTLSLKSVFVLDDDDYYLWGYSGSASAFLFIPFAAIEGKITANGKGYQKRTFFPKFLGIA